MEVLFGKKIKNRRMKNYTNQNFAKLDMGLNLIMIKLLMFIVLLVIPQIFFYTRVYQKTRVSYNLVQVYSNIINYWEVNQGMHIYALETMIWDYDIKIWDKDPEIAYNQLKEEMNTIIIPRIEQSKSFDLESYTNTYRDIILVIYYIKYIGLFLWLFS